MHEKKVYLDKAEVEKKRYREELKSYRQSDAYQVYLHKKRLKRLQGNGTEESDMDATDEIDVRLVVITFMRLQFYLDFSMRVKMSQLNDRYYSWVYF